LRQKPEALALGFFVAEAQAAEILPLFDLDSGIGIADGETDAVTTGNE